MKTILKTLLVILSIFLVSCEKNDKKPLPISTLEVTKITATTAVCGGEMDEFFLLAIRGICWSTSKNPTTDDFTCYDDSTYEKNFFCEMTNLIPNTKYYVRAFNEVGSKIKYGEQKEFTTLAQ